MRRRTSPFSLGRPLLRPELSKGTAKRDARMPTARSLRLPSVASTSRARSRLRSAGMRTRTSLRSRAITWSDSTNVLSGAAKLLAHEKDPLHHRDPRRRGEKRHRRRKNEVVNRREHEAGGDDHDALGPAPEADVPAEAESLRSRACIAHEEGARDRGERERDSPHLVVTHEHEADRRNHEPLADPVARGVEECAERAADAAAPREGAVQDIEDRPHHEEDGAEPVETPAEVLEEDGDRAGDAEADTRDRERVRGDLGLLQLRHRL